MAHDKTKAEYEMEGIIMKVRITTDSNNTGYYLCIGHTLVLECNGPMDREQAEVIAQVAFKAGQDHRTKQISELLGVK